MDIDIDNLLRCQFMQLSVDTEPLRLNQTVTYNSNVSDVADDGDNDKDSSDNDDGNDANYDEIYFDDADDELDNDEDNFSCSHHKHDALLLWNELEKEDSDSVSECYAFEIEYAG